MYTEYFGFSDRPFSIAPDPRYLFMSDAHREAMAHLRYGVHSDGGFVLVTGEIGAGKTTLCRSLLQNLPENLDIAYVLNPRVTVIELLETIIDELRLDRPDSPSVKHLVDRLNLHLLENHARGRKTILIIDEAQNLSAEVLEQLRLLTNLETDERKLLQIVLIGQPELRQMLARPEMQQLAQRITARYHLGPLARDEIAGYVHHRLQVAGGSKALFPPGVLRRLGSMTRGVPRLINLICDRALLGAYARECRAVDASILRQAAREVLDHGREPKGRVSLRKVGGILLLLACTAGVAVFWMGFQLESPGRMWTRFIGPSPGQAPSPAPVVQQRPDSSPNTGGISATSKASSPKAGLPPPEPPSDRTDLKLVFNRARAFADLAALWNLPLPDDGNAGCTEALADGLRCLARQDSLEALRRLDRPALLTLYADDGTPGFAVLARLDDETATLQSAGQVHELRIRDLKPRWFGEFLILWRPPVETIRLLEPGTTDDGIAWLAKTLEELGHYRVTGDEERLEGELLGSLKRFQYAAGLIPDGVVGPLTMIHLNTAAKSAGPRLRPGKAG